MENKLIQENDIIIATEHSGAVVEEMAIQIIHLN